MAKASVIEREKKRATLRVKHFAYRNLLKNLLRCSTVSTSEKQCIRTKLHKLPRDSSDVRRRSRCVVTGRARGVFRCFGLARMCIRELAFNGEIPGLSLSSW
ncbi:30S ribosomal protein S14 [Candidatus Tremblaya phenacola]|uniref:30S ribosomal protein S14 n=1 Tax=Candidatus Tremblayella phenacoccinincola TaxID=1010676 RepID=UPI00133110F9|nr:30S ribosomal protein S14 [Candidatus Tremblaya phenacola]KAH0998254.1 SSU ribosomal protein S14p, zinc-independent [Candidatus Tremblaya phenacola]